MNIVNQNPGRIPCVYDADPKTVFDPVLTMRNTICPSLRMPILQNTPVTIQDDNGHDITDDEITTNVLNCLGSTVDVDSEKWVKGLFKDLLLHFNPTMNVNVRELYVNQSATKAGIPEPGPLVLYNAKDDIIEPSKQFLTGQYDYDKFFATYAFFARVQTLGFYFVNEIAFEEFKKYVATMTQVYTQSGLIDADTSKLLTDFQSLKLNVLTESLRIRNDANENNDPCSFARIIVSLLMEHLKNTPYTTAGIMPFDMSELFCPTTLVFINVERHAHATPRQVQDEWDIIQQSLQDKLKMTSNNQLSRLTATRRAIQKSQTTAAAVSSRLNNPQRSAMTIFQPNPPTTTDLVKYISKLCAKQGRVNKSSNTYKAVTMTFNKPNRREPDNFNKQGKSISIRFRPDIHLYVDTSGSISEEDYKSAVQVAIAIAIKMNVDMYFNSFADGLSQTTKLHTKGKSVQQVWAELQKVIKVTGGTDYVPIWQYINMSKRRQREMSLCITDFEWTPPNRFVQHPTNLYYTPCSNHNWSSMQYHAKLFIESMQTIEPNIRSRVLM